MFYGNKTNISSVTSVTIGQLHRERPISLTDFITSERTHVDILLLLLINGMTLKSKCSFHGKLNIIYMHITIWTDFQQVKCMAVTLDIQTVNHNVHHTIQMNYS